MSRDETARQHIVIATFRLHPHRADEFLALITAHAARSLHEEPGCLRFDVLRPNGQADQVMLCEVYTAAAAFAQHRRTSRYEAFLRDIEGMVAEFSRVECARAFPH